MQAPKHGSAPIDRRTGLFSRDWYNYLTGLSAPVATAETSDPIAGVTGWGLLVKNRFGLFVRRLTSSTLSITNASGADADPVIDLAALADTGVGESLKKITRDTYGRIEGSQDATAADLPYDNATSGIAPDDVQGAIDKAVGALPYFSATAPDPDVHPVWVDTTEGVLYYWYDDGTSAQWVQFGTAGGAAVDAMCPYSIASGETFSVPINKQLTYAAAIDIEGALELDGMLIEVD